MLSSRSVLPMSHALRESFSIALRLPPSLPQPPSSSGWYPTSRCLFSLYEVLYLEPPDYIYCTDLIVSLSRMLLVWTVD